MPPVGFEPTISGGERPQTYALDRAATGTGTTFMYRILMTKSVVKRIFGRVGRRWKGVKINRNEIGWERVYWIHLAQDTGKGGASLNCNSPSVGAGNSFSVVTVRGWIVRGLNLRIGKILPSKTSRPTVAPPFLSLLFSEHQLSGVPGRKAAGVSC